MTEVALLIIGGAITFVVERLIAWSGGKDTVSSLRRDNDRLAQENKDLGKRLADCLQAEQERIAKEKYDKHHGRDQNEVDILRILGTQNGKSVKQIVEQLGISEELAIKHLVDLCCDNCVESAHYMSGSEEWALAPCDSVWYIRQAGRDYLAQNNLL
jgi:regulator of replication initiation timing